MIRAFYNDTDRYCCDWLSNLMDAGEITPGVIDDRPIQELTPDDVKGYDRAHFFAGIGGWDVAINLARWPDARPVWTGSCPCQPFSAAGQGKAGNDERHLWPSWSSLIAKCRPGTVFGEQVEAAIGWGWLDLVFSDLEKEGYACGAAVLPACGVGAPHIRQRLWFVAQSSGTERRQGRSERPGTGGAGPHAEPSGPGDARGMDDAASARRDWTLSGTEENTRDKARLRLSGAGRAARGVADAVRPGQPEGRARTGNGPAAGSGVAGGLGDAESVGLLGWQDDLNERRRERSSGQGSTSGGLDDADGAGSQGRRINAGEHASECAPRQTGASFWSDAEWLPCSDGKARPVRPGSFPLASGILRRPSKLRAYGNAIVPQVAAEMISAFMETNQ